MTTIKHIPDDLGVRSLRQDNLRPETAHPVSSVAPVHSVTSSPGTQAVEVQPRSERRKVERRRGNRRQQQEQALLDTRTGDERRKTGRRKTEADAPQNETVTHIDIEV